MIVTGLVGSLVQSQYKWGFFVFGCVAMFMVLSVAYSPTSLTVQLHPHLLGSQGRAGDR